MAFKVLFDLKELIGKGSFAEVWRCVDKTGKSYAVKILEFDSMTGRNGKERVDNEAQVYESLNRHKNVIDLYHIFRTPSCYYLVMEFADGGNLFDEIVKCNSFNEQDACHYAKQIINGLSYCHRRKIVHRDLKPDNLLIVIEDERRILKLGDFGLARKLDQGSSKTVCEPNGALLYIAPEIVLETAIGLAVDMWACGVILFILLAGYPPFWHEKDELLLLSVVQGKYTFVSPFWDGVSESAKDLIRKLLTNDPCKRVTAQEAAQHAWLKDKLALPTDNRINDMQRLPQFKASSSGSIASLKEEVKFDLTLLKTKHLSNKDSV